MSESRQQLLFDGRELETVDVSIPSIGTKTAQQLGMDPEAIHQGDELEAVVRYRVTSVNHGASIDAEGYEKSEFGRLYVLQPIKTSFKITAHLSREDREAQWQEAHGVGTA